MNVPLDPARLGATACVSTRLVLGMPQLAYGGLSETWALKTLGDAHWRLIAEAAGFERPDFRDADGRRLYPAFCAVSAEALRFERCGEHDALQILSEVCFASRTRFASRHRLLCGSEEVGRIELLSTFVGRAAEGRNRSIARACPVGMAPVEMVGSEPGVLRLWRERRGDGSRPENREGVVFRPCPSQDFNGAKLLYFASYQAMVDRAEWETMDEAAAFGALRGRRITFHGNLEPGEGVRVSLTSLERCGADLRHAMTLTAAGDGRRLAEVTTHKALR